MRALLIVGTRPEAIKLAPVYHGFTGTRVRPLVGLTGQHAELHGLCKMLGMPVSYSSTAKVGEGLGYLFNHVSLQTEYQIEMLTPDAIVVQGDTTSALAGALTAMHARIPLGHVEAGLRTSRREYPFPEEMNRRIISQIADWHYAPTSNAEARLQREHVAGEILMTGNTVVDALRLVLATPPDPAGSELASFIESKLDARYVILVTCHRREHWGEPMTLLAQALDSIAAALEHSHRFFWVLHPNPAAQPAYVPRKMIVLDPLPYPDFIRLLARAHHVMTDSGGVVEEATTLHISTTILRSQTERGEAFECPNVILGGSPQEAQQIGLPAYTRQLRAEVERWPVAEATSNIFGDGRAGARIAQHIVAKLEERGR